jgi:hypothetical protein
LRLIDGDCVCNCRHSKIAKMKSTAPSSLNIPPSSLLILATYTQPGWTAPCLQGNGAAGLHRLQRHWKPWIAASRTMSLMEARASGLHSRHSCTVEDIEARAPGTRTRTRTRTRHGWHGGAERGLEGTLGPPTDPLSPPTYKLHNFIFMWCWRPWRIWRPSNIAL